MAKSIFSLVQQKDYFLDLAIKTDKKILAIWAVDCAKRVFPYFENKYSKDLRPRKAIETLQAWINTGVFKMSVIRKASLDAHAAAREAGESNYLATNSLDAVNKERRWQYKRLRELRKSL